MRTAAMCDVLEQSFGERLRQGREELGLSQAKAAQQAGVGVTAWRDAERGHPLNRPDRLGRYRPDRINVRKMARLLDWPADQALRWAGYDEPVAESAPGQAAPRVEPLDPMKEIARLIAELSPSQQWALVLLAGTMANPDAPIPGGALRRPVAVDCIPVEPTDKDQRGRGR